MPTAAEVFNNPKFQALSPADKLAVLRRIDPNFAKLSPAEQQQVVNFQPSATTARSTAGTQTRGEPASQVPDVSTAGGGASELAGGFGKTLWNILPGLWQTAKEQAPTDDWSLKGGLTNIGKMIEGPAGMIINPLAKATGTAAKWYWDAARGKVPYPYEQVLSAAPEALGQGLAQYLLARGPIETAARKLAGTPVAATAAPTGLFGILNRAKSEMNRLEGAYGSELIDATEIEKQANRVKSMERFGTTTPAPINKLLDMLNGRPHPYLTFQEARSFESIIGDRSINWDAIAGGKVNGLMKQVDGAIGDANADMLKPRGEDVAYTTAKNDFTRGYTAIRRGKYVGGVVGSGAGLAVGEQVGHPFWGGAIGGTIGRGAPEYGWEGLGPLAAKAYVEPGAVLRGTAGALGAAGQAARLGGAAQALTPQQETEARDAIRQLVQERLHPPGQGQP